MCSLCYFWGLSCLWLVSLAGLAGKFGAKGKERVGKLYNIFWLIKRKEALCKLRAKYD